MLAACTAWVAPAAAQNASRPLRVYGNTKTIELAPVLLAADRIHKDARDGDERRHPESVHRRGRTSRRMRRRRRCAQSVDHPNLRIILTVSEGFYRIIARRSAGRDEACGPQGQADRDVRPHVVRVLPRQDARYGRADRSRRHHHHQHGDGEGAGGDEARRARRHDGVGTGDPERPGRARRGCDRVPGSLGVSRALQPEHDGGESGEPADARADRVVRALAHQGVRAHSRASRRMCGRWWRSPRDTTPRSSRACGITKGIRARWWRTCSTCSSKRMSGSPRSAIARRALARSSATLIDASVLKEALEQERAEERATPTRP